MIAICTEGGLLSDGRFIEAGTMFEYDTCLKIGNVEYDVVQSSDRNKVYCGSCWFEIIKGRRFEAVSYAPKDTKLPQRATKNSAGYDIYAPCDIFVPANGFSELIPLNIKAYMNEDEFLGLYIRSSLATKKKNGYLQVSQGTAIIDSDYVDNETNEGNIAIEFQNRSNTDVIINKGDRCCQGIFQKYYITDDDNASNERTGGFGSTNR